ncbi:MAG: hypothetical protein A2096_10890 [Spirochaetes bacterium GWF1_41_5]|nr:MAG: hypothetical protein A2096_10890 [Spirochaetes bacterium GWF1_41_5]HBE03451.1 xylose isomerase [Spirochaetia bacterium]
MNFKTGIIIDSLKLPIKDGIAKAKDLGADGFQVYCVEGEMAPENMQGNRLRELKDYIAKLGLEISALCGDLGKGFTDKELNKTTVPRSKEFIDLAVRLGVKIVTTHIGKLPEDENSPVWDIAAESVIELAKYAEENGCYFASETGPDKPAVLKKFLSRIRSTGIKINYDPANLIMAGPYDHIGGVSTLRDYIVHTHAKDGVCLWQNPEGRNKYLEVPLGEGSVAFTYYLRALKEINYSGYLTVEREVGDNPVKDIGMAVKFLKKKISEL